MWFTSSEVPRPSVPLPGMLDYDHFLIQTLNFKNHGGHLIIYPLPVYNLRFQRDFAVKKKYKLFLLQI